jgi:hypothetical protein
MAGPLGVLPTCPTVATTEVVDVDDEPLWVLPTGSGHH